MYSATYSANNAYASSSPPQLRRFRPRTNVPWAAAALFVAAACGLYIWATFASQARQSTIDLVAEYDLRFKQEPLLLRAIVPTAIAYALLSVANLGCCVYRTRLASRGISTTRFKRRFLVASYVCNVTHWLLLAWVVVTLAGSAVWCSAAAEFDASAQYFINATQGGGFMEARVQGGAAERTLPSPLAPYGLQAAGLARSQPGQAAARRLAGSSQVGAPWPWPVPPGPDPGPGPQPWPGMPCLPNCLDVSSWTMFEGGPCVCDLPTRTAKAQPYAARTWHLLVTALAGIAVMYCASSAFLMILSSHMARTHAEWELLPRMSEAYGYVTAGVRSMSDESAHYIPPLLGSLPSPGRTASPYSTTT